jgi:hypothetical protein
MFGSYGDLIKARACATCPTFNELHAPGLSVSLRNIAVTNAVSFGGSAGGVGDVLVSRGPSAPPVWVQNQSDRARIEVLQKANFVLTGANLRPFTFVWIRASGSYILKLPDSVPKDTIVFVRNDSDSFWTVDTNRAGLIYHTSRPNGSLRLRRSSSITLSAAATPVGQPIHWIVVADQNMSVSGQRFMLTGGMTSGGSTGNVVVSNGAKTLATLTPNTSNSLFYLVYEDLTNSANSWTLLNRGYLLHNGVCLDADGNILVCGVVIDDQSSTVNFQSTDSISISMSYTLGTGTDTPAGFVLKYDTAGKLKWARQFWNLMDTIGGIFPFNVSTSDDRSVYISGTSTNLGTIFSNGSSASVTIGNGVANSSPFLTKYNEFGDIQWVACVKSTYTIGTANVKSWNDNENDVYLFVSPFIGVSPPSTNSSIPRTLDDPSTTTFKKSNLNSYSFDTNMVVTATMANVSFIVKYDKENGTPLWFTKIQGTFSSNTSSVCFSSPNSISFVLLSCPFLNTTLSNSVVVTDVNAKSKTMLPVAGNEAMHVLTQVTSKGELLSTIKISGTNVWKYSAVNYYSDEAVYTALPCLNSAEVNLYNVDSESPALTLTNISESSYCLLTRYTADLSIETWAIIGNADSVDNIAFDADGNVTISTLTVAGKNIILYEAELRNTVSKTLYNPVPDNLTSNIRFIIKLNSFFKFISYEAHQGQASQSSPHFNVFQQSVQFYG